MSKDSIRPLLKLFKAVNEDDEVTIESCSETEFYYEIMISNAAISDKRQAAVTQFFGGRIHSIQPISERQGLCVQVSKVDLPSYYDVMKALPYLDKAESKQSGLFVGIGEFGPVHVNFDDLRHFIICGASGSGKSRFARQLISQNIAFHPEIVNHIVDPKNVDFRAYDGLPGVGKIARDKDSWTSLMAALIVEQGIRETVFSEAFESPPSTLSEYHAVRAEQNRTDLPEFPRIIVWIDEAHMLLTRFNDFTYCYHFISMLARKGRSAGIHLGLISQRVSDIPSVVQTQCATQFLFHLNDPANASWLNNDLHNLVNERTSGTPGRLVVNCSNWETPKVAQAPDCTAEDALAIGLGAGVAKVKNYGFTSLKLDPKVLQNGALTALLIDGNNIRTALTTLHDMLGVGARLPVALPSQTLSYVIPPEYNALYDTFDVRSELLKRDVSHSTQSTIAVRAEPARGMFDDFLAPSTSNWFVRSKNKPTMVASTTRLQNAMTKTENQSFAWTVRDLSNNEGIEAIRTFLRTPVISPWSPEIQENLLNIGLSPTVASQIEDFIGAHQQATQLKDKTRVLSLSVDDKIIARHVAGYVATRCALSVVETASPRTQGRMGGISLGMEGESPQSSGSDSLQDLPDEQLYFSASFANKKAFKINGHALILCDSSLRAEVMASSLHSGSVVICYGRMQATQISQSSTPSMLVKIDEDALLARPSDFVPLARFEIRRALRLIAVSETVVAKVEETSMAAVVAMLADVPRTNRTRTLRRLAMKLANEVEWASASAEISLVELIDRIAGEIRASLATAAAPDSVTVIAPSRRLKDISLDEDAERGILETITRGRMAQGVASAQYAFLKKLRSTPQVVALFHGPQGTGKTLGAEVVAAELGVMLWKVDISAVQSKYVGDTEKQFTELFERAAAQKAVLLLDECDAFLGKREEQSASHSKKWVNHLLTLIEGHAGVIIMTTNFADSLDAAIGRRCEPRVEFAVPSIDTVAGIIRSMLLPDAPISSDFDFYACAYVAEGLSGGYVRNAIERAAIRMLSSGAVDLTTEDVTTAIAEIREEAGLPKGKSIDSKKGNGRVIGFGAA